METNKTVELTEDLTAEVKDLIARVGIKHKTVARYHLDISAAYLSSILAGRQQPGHKVLRKMVALRDNLKSSKLVAG